MSGQKFDQGGYIPGGTVEVLVIPYADRDKPLPLEVDPLRLIGPLECIVDREMRCVRSDHPHEVTG